MCKVVLGTRGKVALREASFPWSLVERVEHFVEEAVIRHPSGHLKCLLRLFRETDQELPGLAGSCYSVQVSLCSGHTWGIWEQSREYEQKVGRARGWGQGSLG